MRERAAQSLNPEMGRMGAEDPSTAFRLRLLQRYWPTAESIEPSDGAARRS